MVEDVFGVECVFLAVGLLDIFTVIQLSFELVIGFFEAHFFEL